MKRGLVCLAFLLLCTITIMYLPQVSAAGVDVIGTTDWLPVMPNNYQFDYAEDQQTGSGSVSQDIVGDETFRVFYVQYSETANEIGFRIRLDNKDGNTTIQFKNFAFVGVDADMNGGIDFFIGVYNPTGSGRIGIYNSDPGEANTGPSTTGIDGTPLVSYAPVADTNYSMMLTGDGSSFLGDPDYFITFKVPVADINSAMTAAGKAITVDSSSRLRYIVGTAAQDNSFNQDIAGIEGIDTKDTRTWEELGVFSPVLSLDGNAVPAAVDGSITTNENTPVSGTLTASDPDGDSLTYSIVNQGSKGTVTITDAVSGAYTYTPAAGQTGADSFTFKANDGALDSNTATISVTINTVNSAPAASNGSITTNENTPVSGTLTATDPDGDSLTYSIVSQGSKGTVTITDAVSGAYTYTPAAGQTGADSFTFKANDGALDSNTATISVTINTVNSAPAASNGSVTTSAGTPVSGTLTATDPDGDGLTYSIVSQGSKGNVTVNALTGAFTYTPAAGQTGADSFTFKANDGALDSNTATISVTINTVNSAPAASNGSITTNENTPVSGTLTATDPDGDSLTYSIVSQGSKGTVTITDAVSGAFTYTPAEGQTGADSFTFKANDGALDSNTATISVTINTVNSAPAASNGSVTTSAGTPVSGTLTATDPDGDSLTYSIVSQGSKGNVAITDAVSGAFTYTPAAGQTGADSFTFKANDGALDSNTATISVTINTPPAADDVSTSFSGTEASGSISATDPDGDTLLYSLKALSGPNHGTADVDAGGSWTYTPDPGYTGSDSFVVLADDGKGGIIEVTVTITVLAAANQAPVAANSSRTTSEDTAVSGTLTASDHDGDSLTYSIVSQGSKGTVTVNALTGEFTYTPSSGITGVDSFTFRANDGSLDSNIATVTVSIIPDNLPPAATDVSTSFSGTETCGSISATDPDGDLMSFSIKGGFGPAHGTAVIDADGKWTYSPEPGFTGSDSFVVLVDDGRGGITELIITLSVMAMGPEELPVTGTNLHIIVLLGLVLILASFILCYKGLRTNH